MTSESLEQKFIENLINMNKSELIKIITELEGKSEYLEIKEAITQKLNA